MTPFMKELSDKLQGLVPMLITYATRGHHRRLAKRFTTAALSAMVAERYQGSCGSVTDADLLEAMSIGNRAALAFQRYHERNQGSDRESGEKAASETESGRKLVLGVVVL